MFLNRSEYDRGPNTFSPEGRLFQVEYAIEAIKLGSTAIGIQTSEGVILAVEKRITSPLMEPTSIEKIVEIDSHIACAFSGLTADSKTLIDRARVESQNHWFTYDEKMQVESVAQAVSNLAIQFGDSDDDAGVMSRPFGVAILFAGMDDNGTQLYHMDPSGTYLQFDAKAIGSGSEGAQQSLQEAYHKSMTQLYHMDPSGTYLQFDAKAIGSGSEGAQQSLQEAYHKSMTLKEATKSAFTILKQVMEEKLNETNVEAATVTPEGGFRLIKGEELESIIKELA